MDRWSIVTPLTVLTRMSVLTADINQVTFELLEPLVSATPGKRASKMTPDFPGRLLLLFRKTGGDFAF
jgi:hypothetical protein